MLLYSGKQYQFGFIAKKLFFSVPRALHNVSFQNYIHATLLQILLNVTQFLKQTVLSYIVFCGRHTTEPLHVSLLNVFE